MQTQKNETQTTMMMTKVYQHCIHLSSAYRFDPAKGVGSGHGKDRMFYEGVLIGVSRQPEFDAARWLLAEGLALPSDRLTSFRGDTPCIFTTVGRAAKLAVRETGKHGPKIVAYRGEEHKEKLMALRTRMNSPERGPMVSVEA